MGGAMYESQDDPLVEEGLHRFEMSLEEGVLGKVAEWCSQLDEASPG